MESSQPLLSKKDLKNLHQFILRATNRGDVTWYWDFETHVKSLDSFRYAMNTEPELWPILNTPFKDLPIYLGTYRDKRFVGGWDRAVLKWRLEVGR